MGKIFVYRRTLLTQVAYIASYGAQIPLNIGIFIESISSLQVLAIVFNSSFLPSDDHKVFIFNQIRNIASLIGLFNTQSSFKTEVFPFLVWIIISMYLLGYLIFMFIITRLCSKGIKVNKWITRICTAINIIHSQVLFAPISYFYFNGIFSQNQCGYENKYSFFCGNWLTAVSIPLLIINYAFAYVKEIYFYQTYRSKNTFSVTSNLHAIVQLSHKAVLLPLITLRDNLIVTKSVLNLVFSLFYHELLFLKLPFYQIKCLRIAVLQATISATASLILFWKILAESEHQIFELAIFLLTPMLVKLMNRRLTYLFERILNLKTNSSNAIVHISGLLKDYLIHSVQATRVDFKTFYTHGLFKFNKLDTNILDESTSPFKYQRNRLILQQFLRFHKKSPKSVNIILSLIQFYVEKMKNVSQAIVFVQKTESLPLSVPFLNNLKQIRKRLEKLLLQAYSENNESLELINYFKYREISNTLKKTIEKEAAIHMEFWQTISKAKIEAHKVLKISQGIEELASRIQNIWQENENYFAKNFPIPMIIYIAYLSIVRGSPHLGQAIINKSSGKSSRLLKFVEKWFSQEKALIVVSNQKGQLGKILDASHSIKNLFNIGKEDLIGRKVNILMPNMIREKHDQFIQRYNDKPVHDLDHNFHLYCKTIDGLFFCANLKVKVYPYIDKGSAIIGILDKKEEYTSMFFLDVNGTILDCSQELSDTFNLDLSFNRESKIQDYAPEFDKINKAFNEVYLPQVSCITLTENAISSDNEFPEHNFDTMSHRLESQKLVSYRTHTGYLMSEILPIIREETMVSFPKRGDQPGLTDFPSTSHEDRRTTKTNKLSIFRGGHLGLSDEESSVPLELCETLKSGKSHEESHREVGDGNKMSEYKRICEEFTAGGVVLFRSKSPSALSEGWMKYFVTIEHLILDRQLYKVVKVKRIHRKSRTQNMGTLPSRLALQSLTQVESGTGGGFLSGMRRNKYKEEELIRKAQERSTIMELNPNLAIQQLVKSENEASPKKEDNNVVSKEQLYSNSQSQDNLKVKEVLHNLLAKENTRTFTNVYPLFFYFAMLLVITIAILSFNLTKDSFDQIRLAVELVRIDGQRLTSLIKLWAIVNTLRLSVITNEETGLSFQWIYDNQIRAVMETNRQLTLLLANTNSKEIIDEFYKKDIQLWEPYSNGGPNSLEFDVFTASQIILNKFKPLIDQFFQNSTIDQNLAIFILNNTANDLMLSAEKEVITTEKIKNDIYNKNLFTLKELVIAQGFSIIVLSFSLFAVAIAILKAYKKMFRVLLTIPTRHMEVRKQQLTLFQQTLGEKFESMKFIQELNMFLEDIFQTKETNYQKAIGFRKESQIFFKKLILKGVLLLIISFFLFGMIFGLSCLSSVLSVQNIDRLEYINNCNVLSSQLTLETYLLTGNFMYWTMFYNQTNMQIKNERPDEQYFKNIKLLKATNNDLISTFLDQEAEFYDSNIEKLLSTSVCSFISKRYVVQQFCLAATKGTTLGLLGLNNQFYDLISGVVEQFTENPVNKLNQTSFIHNYFIQSPAIIFTIDETGTFLLNYFLESLSQTTQKQHTDSIVIFCIIISSCICVTLLVRLFILEKFAVVYKKRHQVLKLIPQDIILENKAIMFYVKREFSYEITEIKSIL